MPKSQLLKRNQPPTCQRVLLLKSNITKIRNSTVSKNLLKGLEGDVQSVDHVAGFGVDLKDLEPSQKNDSFLHEFNASHHTSSGNLGKTFRGVLIQS
jgi:hypothetical protein